MRRPAVLRLTPPETPEQRIRAVLRDEPTISIRQLASRAGVSHSTASKYAHVVRFEASRAAQ
jgi:DNA-binding MurR/RpiR family transcriptional regulator